MKLSVTGTIDGPAGYFRWRFWSLIDVEHDRIVSYSEILTDEVIKSRRSYRIFKGRAEASGWVIAVAPEHRGAA